MYVTVIDINDKEFEHEVINYSHILIENKETGKKETLESLFERIENNY
jgi:hypothetical protein